MAWGKKLLLSLSVFAIMLRKRFPDGSKKEKTITRVVWVLNDFDSSAIAAFEVDVLQRGESRPWHAQQSWFEALPYHTEMHWVSTLSMAPE